MVFAILWLSNAIYKCFPYVKNSAMDNFSKLFQAELKGDVHNVFSSSITVILLFLMNLLPK